MMDTDPTPQTSAQSSPQSSPQSAPDIIPDHTQHRELGSECYRRGDYSGAVDAYARALQCSSASDSDKALLSNNRAAALLMLQRQSEAVVDCDNAVRFAGSDSITIVKAMARKSTALKQLGRLQGAIETIEAALLIDASASSLIKDLATLRSAKTKMDQLKSINGSSSSSLQRQKLVDAITAELGCTFRDLQMVKLRVLLDDGRLEEAYNMSNALMRQAGGSSDVDLLVMRSRVLYLRGDMESAIKHLQQAMRGDPDNSDARGMLRRVKETDELKRSGDSLFRDGRLAEAVDKWTACIASDPSNRSIMSKVHCNRGTALMKMRRLDEAIVDFSKAIEADAAYLKAQIKRADCYHSIGGDKITLAIADYESVLERAADESMAREVKGKLQTAKVSLKRSRGKDLYAVLGVPRDAEDEEIRRAYKKAALRFHPDKQAGKTEEEQAAAEALFKGVNEAYEILSDADKRRRYDSGVEVEDIDNEHAGGGHHHGGGGMDPNMVFQMFMQQQQQQQQRRGGRC